MARKSSRRRIGRRAPASVLETWDSLVRLSGMDPAHPVVVRARAAMVAGEPSPDGPLFVKAADAAGNPIYGPSDVGRRAIRSGPPLTPDEEMAAILEAEAATPLPVRIAQVEAFFRTAPLGELEEFLAALRDWPLTPGESWDQRAQSIADVRRAIALRTGTDGPPRRPDP
jgi:hypothetical protein